MPTASPPIPPCETSGLIDLCGVGHVLSSGWFTIQVSNLVWFAVLLVIVVLAIAIPFRPRVVNEKPSGVATGGIGAGTGDAPDAAVTP